MPALLAAWGAALGAALFVLAHKAIPDDGLITAAFARNLADHGCWCLTAGVESNTATSPLHVVLLAVVTWLTGHPLWALAAVLMVSLAAVAVWVRDLAGAPAGVLAPLLLAVSPVFASAVGMETFLVAAVLVGVVRFAVHGQWAVAGAFVGLAWLARPDVLIPAVVAYVVLAVTMRAWDAWRGIPVAVFVVGPWTVFSWLHFGSAWANSATVKWANGAWNGSTITDWSFFHSQWPGVSVVTAVSMALGVLAGLVAVAARAWPAVAFAAAGAAHLAALSIATTPPIFYYLGPSVGCALLAITLVATALLRPVVRRSPGSLFASPADAHPSLPVVVAGSPRPSRVRFVKRVPVVTLLPAAHVPPRQAALRVHRGSDWLQMIRAHAPSHPAKVVHVQAVRNGGNKGFIEQSMNSQRADIAGHRAVTDTEHGVTAAESSAPQPAARVGFRVGAGPNLLRDAGVSPVHYGAQVGSWLRQAFRQSVGCLRTRRTSIRVYIVYVGLATLAIANLGILVHNGAWWDRGIAPVRQNWGTDQQYAAIAAGLPRDGWVLGGEIGGLAYYCADHGCKVVDPVLSDPGRTDVLVEKWRLEHPTLSAINYRNYQPPAPVPVTYRIRFGATQPGPGPSWPITRNPGIDQWAVLELAPDPLQQAN